mmetsp:Transcript_12718/g.19177  ORF Transcript_12718/g.19177 Transcript_12718/m.19177 type:complete len:295 (-) Transcript_12718:996-1880(-)
MVQSSLWFYQIQDEDILQLLLTIKILLNISPVTVVISLVGNCCKWFVSHSIRSVLSINSVTDASIHTIHIIHVFGRNYDNIEVDSFVGALLIINMKHLWSPHQFILLGNLHACSHNNWEWEHLDRYLNSIVVQGNTNCRKQTASSTGFLSTWNKKFLNLVYGLISDIRSKRGNHRQLLSYFHIKLIATNQFSWQKYLVFISTHDLNHWSGIGIFQLNFFLFCKVLRMGHVQRLHWQSSRTHIKSQTDNIKGALVKRVYYIFVLINALSLLYFLVGPFMISIRTFFNVFVHHIKH